MDVKKLLVFFLLVSQYSVFAQLGDSFWFVAPNVTAEHTDRPIFLRVAAQGTACTVSISQPANSTFTTLSYALAANQTLSIDLTTYIDAIETGKPDTVQNSGLHISATANITAYYEVRSSGNNTDIFSLKADNGLGTSFLIPAQSFWNNANKYQQSFSMFLLVATENNTQVSITPSAALVGGHTAGVTYTVSLNKGQTYYGRAASRQANGHFGGTRVSSNKPIAITIADDSMENSSYGGCKDLGGDQMIPLNKIGDEYIVTRGFLKNNGNDLDDKIYVLATEDSTDIFINSGASPSYQLNAGEQQEVSLSAGSVYITSSKPIYVLHATGFGCEVGLAVLPSLYCTGSLKVNITRSTSEDFYLLLLVPAGNESNFKTDGNSSTIKTNDFSAVPGTNNQWMRARLKVGTNKIAAGSNTEITNLTSRFHVGVINGGASTGCMYGYFSDYSKVITDKIYHL